MPGSDVFVLQWELHENTRTSTLETLWRNNQFVDVTLVCDDGEDKIQAHQIILSAGSPYFEKVLQNNPQKHPFIVLKGIQKKDLLKLLEFMYCGKTEIHQDELNRFLELANSFKVKGLDFPVEDGPLDKRIGGTYYPQKGTSRRVEQSRVPQLLDQNFEKLKREFDTLKSENKNENKIVTDRRSVTLNETSEEVEVECDIEEVYRGEVLTEVSSAVGGENPKHKRRRAPAVTNEMDAYINQSVNQFNMSYDNSFKEQTEEKVSYIASSDIFYRNGDASWKDYEQQVLQFFQKGEAGNWQCKECTYASGNKSHMLEHVEKHVEGFSFRCRKCNKDFHFKRSLRTHSYKCK